MFSDVLNILPHQCFFRTMIVVTLLEYMSSGYRIMSLHSPGGITPHWERGEICCACQSLLMKNIIVGDLSTNATLECVLFDIKFAVGYVCVSVSACPVTDILATAIPIGMKFSTMVGPRYRLLSIPGRSSSLSGVPPRYPRGYPQNLKF